MIVNKTNNKITVKELKNIQLVKFNDYSEYDSQQSRDGGCYGFWTNAYKLDNGYYELSYETTAEFEYCPCCGSFANHIEEITEDGEYIYSCGDFEQITPEELATRINGFKETPDEYIEMFTKEELEENRKENESFLDDEEYAIII